MIFMRGESSMSASFLNQTKLLLLIMLNFNYFQKIFGTYPKLFCFHLYILA